MLEIQPQKICGGRGAARVQVIPPGARGKIAVREGALQSDIMSRCLVGARRRRGSCSTASKLTRRPAHLHSLSFVLGQGAMAAHVCFVRFLWHVFVCVCVLCVVAHVCVAILARIVAVCRLGLLGVASLWRGSDQLAGRARVALFWRRWAPCVFSPVVAGASGDCVSFGG